MVDIIPEERLLIGLRNMGANKSHRECPNCGASYREGELCCVDCGLIFASGGKTDKLDSTEAKRLERVRRVGEALTDGIRPMTIEVNLEKIVLPNAKEVIIGRASNLPGDISPDVDLTPYDAMEKGVSRLHVKISRDHDLIHVTDLGSTNGTFLNGFKLVPNQSRLLRNSDELLLGRLTARVRF